MKRITSSKIINLTVPKGRLFRAGITGMSKLLSRGISTLAGFLVLPLTAQYLGVDRFGLWLILGTFLAWVSIADLGLSNSLTNVLATAAVTQNRRQAQEAISSVFFLITIISAALAIASIFIFANAPLNSWFNLESWPDQTEAHLAILTCSIIFILRLPLTIPNKIYSAYQEGYIYELWYAASSILAVISIAVAIALKANLFLLIIAFFGVQLLGDIGAAIHIFQFHRPWLKPQIQLFRWGLAKKMMAKSLQIWVAQISTILLYQTDLIIILKLFSASEVGNYGLLLRLFTLVSLIPASFVNPLWSAYSEAQARGDYQWINQTLRKSIGFSLVWSVSLSGGLMLLAPKIVETWLNPNIFTSYSLLWAMFSSTVISAVNQCIATLINGLGETQLQAFIGPLAAVANLILSIILARQWGSSGVAWATAITLSFCMIVLGSDIFIKIHTRKN
jgi:O-antigen/teichoic acid export membrane protein